MSYVSSASIQSRYTDLRFLDDYDVHDREPRASHIAEQLGPTAVLRMRRTMIPIGVVLFGCGTKRRNTPAPPGEDKGRRHQEPADRQGQGKSGRETNCFSAGAHRAPKLQLGGQAGSGRTESLRNLWSAHQEEHLKDLTPAQEIATPSPDNVHEAAR